MAEPMFSDACECGRDDCEVCTVLTVGFGPTEADLFPDSDEDGVFPDGYDVAEDEPLDPHEFIAARRQTDVLGLFAEAQHTAHEMYDDDLDPDLPAGITESHIDSDYF